MEENKLNINKGTKILLWGLFTYFIVMLVIFLPGYIKKQQENIYILTNSYKIKYYKGKWTNITDTKDYKLKKFDVYEGDSYKGNYNILPGNKLNLFENGKNVSYEGNIFAYRGSLKLELFNQKYESEINENDKYAIKEALSKAELEENYDFDFFQKTTIDNTGDIIYCVNNFYTENASKRYSLIFIYNGTDVEIIDKIVTDDNGIYDNPIYAIDNILDIKKDGKLELLYTLNYSNGSNDSECVKLYNLSKKKEMHDFCK